MASWAEFASAEPALASRVQQRFDIRRHKTLATLRTDGSPRISGIEVEFADGEIFLGMMPGSRKLRDLERDPRLALHSPTDDPPAGDPRGWAGEAKLAGYAREVVEKFGAKTAPVPESRASACSKPRRPNGRRSCAPPLPVLRQPEPTRRK